MKIYWPELRKYPLLSPEEERELAKRIERGDKEARERMILSNMRLVISIALRFASSGIPIEDLIQEGTLGLIRAVDGFDWRKGYRFSTYASWCILRAMQIAIQRHRAQDPPEGTVSVDQLLEHGYDEVAAFTRDPEVSPEDELLHLLLPEAVYKAIQGLSQRERAIIKLYYGLGGSSLSLPELAALFGVSISRIRQILRNALRKLRRQGIPLEGLQLLDAEDALGGLVREEYLRRQLLHRLVVALREVLHRRFSE
jgi:RNA polymerase primary sigma factor